VVARESEGFAQVARRLSGCRDGFALVRSAGQGGGWWISGWMEHAPSLEVHGRYCEIEGTGIASQAAIACTREAVHILEQRKQWFDGSADARDQRVAAYDRWTGRVPTIAPTRDPVADAKRLEARPASIAVIGLVGIDALLVPADQLVRRDRVVDVGR